ncbi:hypothetical protein [Fusobacterium hominis]|uniref:Uncharacterized protein n=1 Tax=Fusobacterium hominis TaxID=2764326 RepID=A0A7G9GXK4_9FUSO|nr:hypothetical protein [Fusobacterium hominis]QNM15536.1 hypothetical protein H9Q81_01460 [Fusobacterium hominis]
MTKETLRFVCKRANLEGIKKDMKKFGETRQVVIIKKVKLSAAKYREFTNNLFDEYDFLKNTCEYIDDLGAFTAVEITNEKSSLVVETQGYDYARYVAIR